MQKDNLDLLVEQLISEINWNDDNIVPKSTGKWDPKRGAFVIKPDVGNVGSSNTDPDEIKYNRSITLKAPNGEMYTIIPNDEFREIGDGHQLHHQNSVSPQRGTTRSSRFALKRGGVDTDYTINDKLDSKTVEKYKKEIEKYDSDTDELNKLRNKLTQVAELEKQNKVLDNIISKLSNELGSTFPTNEREEEKFNKLVKSKDDYMDQQRDIAKQIEKLDPEETRKQYRKEFLAYRKKYDDETVGDILSMKKAFIVKNYHDTNDIQSNKVKNTHILSYSQFNNNPTYQALLGQALLDFYKEKGIPENKRPLQINYKKLKQHLDLQAALDYRSDSYDPALVANLRNAKDDEEKKQVIKNYHKYKDAELYPAAAHVSRADEINVDRIQKIYNYQNNMKNFYDKYNSLWPTDKKLVNVLKKVISQQLPSSYIFLDRNTGEQKIKWSPNDLNLLISNYRDLYNNSRKNNGQGGLDQNLLVTNWRKLKNQTNESCFYTLESTLLTEGNPKPIYYDQAVLYDIIVKSGVYFAPQEQSLVGNSYLELFKDHWKDIPHELIVNGDSVGIYELWDVLVENYLLYYYVPKVINWLKANGILEEEEANSADVDNIVKQLKTKFNSTFEFINQYDFKDRKEIIYELITGREYNHDVKAQKRLKKDKNNQDILNRATEYYRNKSGFPVDYGESKYDEMITKVLKELIEE